MPNSLRSDWGEPDSVLATYVTLMDHLIEPVDPGPILSLTVDGLLVSGELIPQWQWFAELSELNDHADAFYVGVAENVKEQSDLAHEATKVRDIGGEMTQRQYVALTAPTRYIHLRNTLIYHPNQDASGDGVLWRGRLSDVSGWTPGTTNKRP
ncbi:hypothetical protein GCM10010435_88540 [Winogradskya consettensis]|uniref:Uncharacterized protein n=2 Tax=Winogradskya TaxID=3240235 RepID=A0A919W1Y9_9ACTN|nr:MULTISPECIES: hypothetical protein [Actinoplanes]GIE19019.1 hypothetical protein Ahu01nite_021210 [Actinoplanes humidus]GIM76963.1 hypothetical protein Aco04nite_53000 [Actinoplanes consettensis]